MNELSIKDVLQQRTNYNLAIPFTESQQVNPFYKMSVALIPVDMSEEAAQVYKVGGKYLNKQWVDLYSLTKPFLQKLATEAGIQFMPGAGDVIKMDENTWKSSAYGALKLPDGTIRTSTNFKVIDLVSEEKKYRLSYEEKAVSGITDYKAAEDAAKKYAGHWEDTGSINDRGYPIKRFVINESERAKYIEASLLDAMTALRAHAPQKAATGAILRVIRDLLGIKLQYTKAELKKPFAVARTSFSPDYTDPAVRQMMLQQAMQSVGNLFGNTQPVVQTISIPQEDTDEVEIPADPQPLPEVEADQQMQHTATNNIVQSTNRTIQKPVQVSGNDKLITKDLYCDKCGVSIPKNVYRYSMDKFGRPLCYKCQKSMGGQ